MKVGDDRGEFKTLLETPKSAYINVSESKSRIEMGEKWFHSVAKDLKDNIFYSPSKFHQTNPKYSWGIADIEDYSFIHQEVRFRRF